MLPFQQVDLPGCQTLQQPDDELIVERHQHRGLLMEDQEEVDMGSQEGGDTQCRDQQEGVTGSGYHKKPTGDEDQPEDVPGGHRGEMEGNWTEPEEMTRRRTGER